MKLNSINNKIKTYKGNNNRPFPEHFIKDLSKYLNKKAGRDTTVGDDFANSRQDTEIKEIITAYDYTYNPYMTSSNFYVDRENSSSITHTIGRWFDCYEGEDLNDDYCLKEAHPLQAGDIIVRSGHVEIYLNQDLSFGWG